MQQRYREILGRSRTIEAAENEEKRDEEEKLPVSNQSI